MNNAEVVEVKGLGTPPMPRPTTNPRKTTMVEVLPRFEAGVPVGMELVEWLDELPSSFDGFTPCGGG